jgi:3-oxoacyl-[acyl-carrier-protein] synthase II
MVAGGADSMLDPVGLVYFALLGAAAPDSGPADSRCRPFDRRRRGLVMGEGAGVVVLEAEDHAHARGRRGHAELAGYGASLDRHLPTTPHPEGLGAARAMTAALADAGLAADEVDYVNAHGTGTQANDVAETLAIRRALGERAGRVPVSSTKSLLGHLIAACGGPELVVTVLSVARGAVHPTRNLTTPDPRCDLDYIAEGARRLRLRAALSSSFGFGGQNACLAVRALE